MQINFKSVFPIEKPIIGMIHLAGEGSQNKIKRALEELEIYEEEGINGAIIEDYHGSPDDVYETLVECSKRNLNLVKGINILRNTYSAFKQAYDFDAKFIQFDSVQTKDLWLYQYDRLRKEYPHIVVLGGVGFKYKEPTGNPLEQDLQEGKSRCEAIVTTGSATGVETPIDKLKEYKQLLGNFPLIVGAGVTLENVSEQLQICDGAIVGSYFKSKGNTYFPVDRKRVKNLMDVVKKIRN